jgi:hypothetical protein
MKIYAWFLVVASLFLAACLGSGANVCVDDGVCSGSEKLQGTCTDCKADLEPSDMYIWFSENQTYVSVIIKSTGADFGQNVPIIIDLESNSNKAQIVKSEWIQFQDNKPVLDVVLNNTDGVINPRFSFDFTQYSGYIGYTYEIPSSFRILGPITGRVVVNVSDRNLNNNIFTKKLNEDWNVENRFVPNYDFAGLKLYSYSSGEYVYGTMDRQSYYVYHTNSSVSESNIQASASVMSSKNLTSIQKEYNRSLSWFYESLLYPQGDVFVYEHPTYSGVYVYNSSVRYTSSSYNYSYNQMRYLWMTPDNKLVNVYFYESGDRSSVLAENYFKEVLKKNPIKSQPKFDVSYFCIDSDGSTDAIYTQGSIEANVYLNGKPVFPSNYDYYMEYYADRPDYLAYYNRNFTTTDWCTGSYLGYVNGQYKYESVHEFGCRDNRVVSTNYACPNGCVNGACVAGDIDLKVNNLPYTESINMRFNESFVVTWSAPDYGYCNSYGQYFLLPNGSNWIDAGNNLSNQGSMTLLGYNTSAVLGIQCWHKPNMTTWYGVQRIINFVESEDPQIFNLSITDAPKTISVGDNIFEFTVLGGYVQCLKSTNETFILNLNSANSQKSFVFTGNPMSPNPYLTNGSTSFEYEGIYINVTDVFLTIVPTFSGGVQFNARDLIIGHFNETTYYLESTGEISLFDRINMTITDYAESSCLEYDTYGNSGRIIVNMTDLKSSSNTRRTFELGDEFELFNTGRSISLEDIYGRTSPDLFVGGSFKVN